MSSAVTFGPPCCLLRGGALTLLAIREVTGCVAANTRAGPYHSLITVYVPVCGRTLTDKLYVSAALSNEVRPVHRTHMVGTVYLHCACPYTTSISSTLLHVCTVQ